MRYLQVLIMILLSSCGAGRQLEVKDLVDQVEDPDGRYVNSKQVGNYHFALTYKPVEYMAARKYGSQLNKEELASFKEKKADLKYFTFRLSSSTGRPVLQEGLPSQDAYFERMAHLNADIAPDFYLKQGMRTYPCVLAHLEQNYGLANHSDIVLAFDTQGSQVDETFQFVYNDKVFGTAPIKMELAQGIFTPVNLKL